MDEVASKAVVGDRISDLRLLVDAAPIAIVVADIDGKLVLVNAETERLFESSRDRLLGSPVESLIPERYRSAHPGLRGGYFSSPSRRAMGAGRDLFALRGDGTEFPVEIGLNPVSTPDGDFVLAAIIDITERRRAEEHLRLVMEAAPNAMIAIDVGGAITLMNAQAERLFGYLRSELIGQSIERLVPQRLRRAHGALRTEYLLSPTARSMGAGRDLFGLRKDGSEVPIEIGLNPISTPKGQFVLAAIIDITERKRAEELRLINAGIHQHNAELEALNKELESFSYSVSHDLRAPVRAIQGYAAILGREHESSLDPEGRRVLGVVRAESLRMGVLIDDLLQFSNLGRKPIERQLVDMTAIARDVAAKEGERAQKADLHVDALPPIYGDRALLEHVWINLISNAIKYSSGQAKPVVRITGWMEGTQAIYRIEDNGVGFNMKYYDKLFGVFARLHHASEFPGTGVGLAIVQRIVMRHGGRIWAQSTQGCGALFSFALPTRRPDER